MTSMGPMTVHENAKTQREDDELKGFSNAGFVVVETI